MVTLTVVPVSAKHPLLAGVSVAAPVSATWYSSKSMAPDLLHWTVYEPAGKRWYVTEKYLQLAAGHSALSALTPATLTAGAGFGSWAEFTTSTSVTVVRPSVAVTSTWIRSGVFQSPTSSVTGALFHRTRWV